MKKRRNYLRKEDHQLFTHEEVFGKVKNDPGFQRAFREEGLRLDLVEQIQKARANKKLTQKELAERAGMSQSIIARLESGEHSITLSTLWKVADALGKKVQLV
jgi:ribosome-binding protein aMBF1 (putative translation factor)